jgi:hypothetical protein
MAMDISKTLRRSLAELRSERTRLDQQISAIETALGALGGRGGRRRAASGTPRQRRPMNPAARKALSQRMRAYWAKRRAAKGAQGKRAGKAAAS